MDDEKYALCEERNSPDAYRRFFGEDSGAQAAAFRALKRRARAQVPDEAKLAAIRSLIAGMDESPA
jgi:hypothetical protein